MFALSFSLLLHNMCIIADYPKVQHFLDTNFRDTFPSERSHQPTNPIAMDNPQTQIKYKFFH